MYAEWVHDVLIVQHGLLLGATAAMPIRFPEGVLDSSPDGFDRPKHLAVTLRLRLDDGQVIQIAAAGAAKDYLAGPFLAVAALDSGSSIAPRPQP